MCRIVLSNRQGISALVTELDSFRQCHTLSSYLRNLELWNGGSGNGLALVKNRKLVFLEKGVDYPVAEIAEALISRDYDWALFHTRQATSIESVNDENCHPFLAEGEHALLMAMNGNENGFDDLRRVFGRITDTEFITRMIARMDLPIPHILSCFQSNTAGFYDGRPFVSKGDRQLLKYRNKEALVFASDFPFGIQGVERLPEKYSWFDGEETLY